ncbi:CopG family antitoxin [Candidatus Thiosymbion oneisti]|nr:CopG family antitoxin [Candidatus Thiosymbion oneisti]
MPSKTPVSSASTYQEIGAFWDEHDATEFGEQTSTKFQVHISSQHRYYLLDRDLSSEIRRIAEQHGISEGTLLNGWIREKIDQIHVVDKKSIA